MNEKELTKENYKELSYRCEYEIIFKEIFLKERKKELKRLIYYILIGIVLSSIIILLLSLIDKIYLSIASFIVFYYLFMIQNKSNSKKLDQIKEKRNKYIKRTTN